MNKKSPFMKAIMKDPEMDTLGSRFISKNIGDVTGVTFQVYVKNPDFYDRKVAQTEAH